MTALQFRNLLVKIGISQVKAAHTLGVSPRTARRWATGAGATIPEPAGKLLRLIHAGKVSEKDVRDTKG